MGIDRHNDAQEYENVFFFLLYIQVNRNSTDWQETNIKVL